MSRPSHIHIRIPHPLAQLLANERLEDGEQHVEHVRIVEDVHRLQAQEQHVLHPLQQHGGERGRELHDVVERQAVKVEDHHAAAHLRGGLAHRAEDAHLHAAEHVVQRALRRLPVLCGRGGNINCAI